MCRTVRDDRHWVEGKVECVTAVAAISWNFYISHFNYYLI
jgi:hypothetical protein